MLLKFNNINAQLRFIENKGQWDKQLLYKAPLKGAELYVTKNKLTYLFYDAEKLHDIQHENVLKDSIKSHVISIEFLNSNPNCEFKAHNSYSDYYNYFIGSDPSKWASRVLSYNKIYVTNIYPNIDFELYEHLGTFKYNFIVKPGGDINDIQLEYKGQDKIELKNGELNIAHSLGNFTEKKPLVFQGNEENVINSSYLLNNNVLSFQVSNKRNFKEPIIIDPVLVFSTYSGSYSDNFGYTATYDDSGNAYSGGTVFNKFFPNGFPSTAGAFQMTFAGGVVEDDPMGYTERDCGILKYDKTGKKLLYATYIGGSLSNEQPHSMIVNRKDELLIMGSTKSPDFPAAAAQGFQRTLAGQSDIFIFKLSSDGTTMLASTFMGGFDFDGLNGDRPSNTVTPLLYNYADDFRGEIIVDTNNNVFVASSTYSNDFPTRNAFDLSYDGGQDGVVFKMNNELDNLIFSSYIGGSNADAAYGIDLGINNDLYIAGGSNSNSFNLLVSGLTNTFLGGRADGYLLRINATTGSALNFTTIGTNNYDQAYFVKTDKYGNPLVYGQSMGVMPVIGNVYSNESSKQFIIKFNPTISNIIWASKFGASGKVLPDISPTAFLVDECERIFISGWGGFSISSFRGGGTYNMPLTKDAIQKNTDGYDFYLAVFSKNMRELLFSTYFGGITTTSNRSHEHVDGGTSRFDKKGIIYQSVCAGCEPNSLFPSTPGAWSRTNNSDNCNNALFKIDFENLNRKPLAKDSFYDVIATDSLNFDIQVRDLDLDDSLRVVLQGDCFTDPNFPKPLPTIRTISHNRNTNTLTSKISWLSQCQHLNLDTIKLFVKVYDRGCPSQDSNQSVIKIVVKDPPLSLTPESICLNFKDNGIQLSWDSFPKNRFFKYLLLYKRLPKGNVQVIDTIRSNQTGLFIDRLVNDPKSNNYQYWLVAYNICNKPYDLGFRVNTTVEFNTPIDSTYMHYATVINNKEVKINWFKSKEPDFGSYDVFKAINLNGTSVSYRLIKSIYDINDTVYIDNNVEVQEKSYCYKIGVNDKCGHVSKPSNEACNIVLSGKAQHLYFDLNWLPYRQWHGGVDHYELIRRVDTGIMRFRTNTNMLRVFKDDELDLWWGAYYYRAIAFEGKNALGEGFNAISESNDLRLIQPPQVYVPNAFSPNQDGFNDVWGVSHAFVKEYNLKVFNRWGEKVWENDFKGNQWDGSYKGKTANNDVFIWIITYKGWDGKFYTQKGNVTVMP